MVRIFKEILCTLNKTNIREEKLVSSDQLTGEFIDIISITKLLGSELNITCCELRTIKNV